MEKQKEGQMSPECTIDKATAATEKYCMSEMTGTTIELTHNHGTEDQADLKFWNGNTGRDAGKPGDANYAEEPATRGFGHIAFNCDDVYEATDRLLANGVAFQKKPDEGRMKACLPAACLLFLLPPPISL
jgi:lactoylglutathione lyase